MYHPGEVDAQAALTAPSTQPSWNPFGDDNFSKLTAEELLNKDFAKLSESEFILHLQQCEIVVRFQKNNDFFASSSSSCTAAAPGEKSMGSSEDLIPGLNAFPGKSIRVISLDIYMQLFHIERGAVSLTLHKS